MCDIFTDIVGRYVLGIVKDGREEWFCQNGGRDYGRNRSIPIWHYSYGRRSDAIRAARKMGYTRIRCWDGNTLVKEI
jgi:hypothetical protein